MIRAIKGTRDLLPPESERFERVERIARRVFRRFNFHEIRTPIFEATELFARSVGEETDIVTKEMYSFVDRGGDALTLRPEATASVMRAYVEHRLWERPGPKRLYYMGPMFRRERPQKGRYRQFYQIGAEALDGEPLQIDFELLAMVGMLLEESGIDGAELRLNSLGCAADRQRYREALQAALNAVKAGLCADCQRRADSNPLRVLDCKVPEDQATIAALPALAAFLCAPCQEHFSGLRELLDEAGLRYAVEPRLVRGLDYYTGTVFEFVHGALGAQNALLGGGRYDGLAQTLGAPAKVGGGIGFAIGEDRFVLALEAANGAAAAGAAAALQVFIAPLATEQRRAALRLAAALRRADLSVEVGEAGRKPGKALELAAKLGARQAVLLGAEEAASGLLTVKDLESGRQEKIAREALAERLRTISSAAGSLAQERAGGE